jgi:diacylglycerol kinase family enzyme
VRRVRALVVVNPRATATTAHERDVLARAVASESDVEIAHTSNRGHAAALACRAMRDGVDVVIAMGGDGTVNEVVNGLLTDGVHDGVPALGVVPAGSTNVFARALGLPNDAIEATARVLVALREGRRRTIGLGRVSTPQLADRWFVFASGVGYDAGIIARVEKHRDRGHRSSYLLYARAGIREFWASERRRPPLHLDLPDGSTVDGLFYAVVTNTDPWTYIGDRPLHPTPNSSFEADLDVYARTSMALPSALLGFAQLARAPREAGGPARLARSARRVPSAASGLVSSRRRKQRRTGQQQQPPERDQAELAQPKLAASEQSAQPARAELGPLKQGGIGALVRHNLAEFVLRADVPMLLQVDGDLLGSHEKLNFRSVRDALRVLI